MALHTKPDFAALCGMRTSNLGNYVKRGKVILSGEYVDDSIDANKIFLEKHSQKKNAVKVEEKKLEPAEAERREFIPRIAEPVRKTTAPKVKRPENMGGMVSQTLLEQAKTIAETDKKELEVRLLQIKIEKQQGTLIPFDLVKICFAQQFKSVTTSFQQACDNMISEIAKKKSLSSKEEAELRGELVKIVNAAINTAVDESKKNIKNVVNEYSEKRAVGERN